MNSFSFPLFRLVIALAALPAMLLPTAHAQPSVPTTPPATPPPAPTPTALAPTTVNQFIIWVQHNDLPQMQTALESEPRLAKALNSWGEPPLRYASSIPAAKLLVDKGADVNISVSYAGGQYKAPLVVLVAMSQPQILPYLVSRGADLLARDTEGNTALIRGAEADQVDSVRFLLQRKLSATDKSNSGQTPLHAWALGEEARSTTIAQMLLARGAKLNAQDNQGRTPLDRAAEYNNVGSIRFLLQRKADTNLVPKSGYSALHWAAENNSVAIAQMLLRHGAKINARDVDGETPLAVATAHKSQQVIQFLKQHGAKL